MRRNEQEMRVAQARGLLATAIADSGEKDISIWIAALSGMLSRVSDWNLEAEREDE